MNFTGMAKTVRDTLVRRSPEILVGIGIAGMVATTILAVRATPGAMRRIDEMKEELHAEKLTPVETVQATWKCYIPAVVTGIFSTSCLIGASSVNLRRNAALATAYTLSETALREYREKVVETIGEKKAESIRDAIAKDKLEKNPLSNNEVIITERGETLCYDAISGRYFRSDIEKLRRAANEVNRRILLDGYASLNDFYDEIGLNPIKIGDDLGWNANRALIDLNPSAQLAEDGTPCMVLNFQVAPIYNYDAY